jgi:hypothetical protein
MSARAFLVRGLLIGLLAGIAAFVVAHQVGEPHVERAIQLEDTSAGHSHGAADESGEEVTEVSRESQRTWGLGTGTLAVGVALGGIVALVAAAAVGRIGRLSAPQSTALVAAIGFVAYALVPFLKYPATPPAVGNAETIGERTGYYFLFVLLSVAAAVVATVLAARWWQRLGVLPAVTLALVGYLVVVVVGAAAMPGVNEVGDFPADTLWSFRLASLLTLAALWAVLGLGLTWAIARLERRAAADRARRELAASL